MTKGILYHTLEEIPEQTWIIQGTSYDSPTEAKFAAAKVYCNNTGAVVKRDSKTGKWVVFYWRAKVANA